MQTTTAETLAEIEAEAARLSERAATSGNAHPTFGYSANFARPHIRIGDGQYHYVAAKRGTEISRRSTSNLDELLYWIFGGMTFFMVCAYELKHRIPRQDFRRLMLNKRVELLTSIDPDMGR